MITRRYIYYALWRDFMPPRRFGGAAPSGAFDASVAADAAFRQRAERLLFKDAALLPRQDG